MRATRLFIDLEKINANIIKIQKYLGSDIEMMPIIKCNAYGTHINKLIDVISNFKYVGVALIDEGIHLRKAGYKGNIFILYPPMKDELKAIQEYNLFFNGCDIEVLEYFNEKANKQLNIHIEIETGMGRTGVQIKNLHPFIERLKKLKKINI